MLPTRRSELPRAVVPNEVPPRVSRQGFIDGNRWLAPGSGPSKRRLLNHCLLSSHDSLMLCFLPALHIGGALARSDLVEGAPLRFHPDMRVARKHGARNVLSDAPDHIGA